MTENAIAPAPAKVSKKEVRKQVHDKLTTALADYKKELGDKKFAAHIKKAGKLISNDLLKSHKKNKPKVKKVTVKKIGKKKKAK